MTVVFPKNNLPEAAQPWAREIQKQLNNIVISSTNDEVNNAARDSQLASSVLSVTALVNEAKTIATTANDAALAASDAAAAAQSAADDAQAAINGLLGLGDGTGSDYTVNANNVQLGAITASSLDLTSASYELKVGTSASKAYLRVAPSAPNGVGINAIGIADLDTGGVIGAWTPFLDDTSNLGNGTYRWARVFAVNTTISSSDSRIKTDIQDASLGLNFIEKLRPVSYKMKIGQRDYIKNEEGEIQYGEDGEALIVERPGVRRHWGLIAQEVKEALDELDAPDFGGYVVNEIDNPDSLLSLSYEQFISPMIKAIQELSARVKELEGR